MPPSLRCLERRLWLLRRTVRATCLWKLHGRCWQLVCCWSHYLDYWWHVVQFLHCVAVNAWPCLLDGACELCGWSMVDACAPIWSLLLFVRQHLQPTSALSNAVQDLVVSLGRHRQIQAIRGETSPTRYARAGRYAAPRVRVASRPIFKVFVEGLYRCYLAKILSVGWPNHLRKMWRANVH
jgi:hypothetical protein